MGVLRVFLALSVVIAHSSTLMGFNFVGGVVAVEIFFIISGFYMSLILDKKYVGTGSYQLFISNRFLRLFPIYWVVVILTIVVSLVMLNYNSRWNVIPNWLEYFDVMSLQTLILQIFTNLALFGQDIEMFYGMRQATGDLYMISNFRHSDPQVWKFLVIPQAWTLGIELTFYLIAPLIVRRRLKHVLVLIGVSMLIRLFTYVYLGYRYDPWTYRFFPSELALFLLGVVAYKAYIFLQQQENILCERNQKLVITMFFSVLLMYEFIPSFVDGSHIKNWLIYLLACVSMPFIFEYTKKSRIDNRIGELSYPIYMSHVLVIMCITPLLKQLNAMSYIGEISSMLTIIVSYLLIITVADPIEKIRSARAATK